MKMPVCPRLQYIENMFINVTQMILCNIFAMQAILYPFKGDVAAERDSDAPSACSEPGGI